MNPNLMHRVIAQARQGMENNEGGPFGAAIVKDNSIVWISNNQVTSSFDPTAHAEIVAIRMACQQLKTISLSGCELYTSCEPCPMCLAASYWARINKIYFAANRADAKDAGFDDAFFYTQVCLPLSERQVPMFELEREKAVEVFGIWKEKKDKIWY